MVSVSSKLPKGKTRRVKSYKESDWREYTSSSQEVNEDILLYGKENFSFVIYEWVSGKGLLTYRECQDQWHGEVMSRIETPDGDRLWYNKQIAAIRFLKPKN